MKLNLGCGNSHRDGWVNVDKMAACQPDQLWDIETFPWPWDSNTVDQVLLSHVLEHVGASTEVYLAVIKELYRICKNDAVITITVPHPRSDDFLIDPTHVRPILPEGLLMFSQAENLKWMAAGVANTPLGIYTEVDFRIESVTVRPTKEWQKKNVSPKALQLAGQSQNNVYDQITVVMRPIKPSTTQRQKLAGLVNAGDGQARA